MARLAAETVEKYLARIEYDHAISVDLDTLSRLQRAHMTHVPFENLDVYAGITVRTDLEWSLPKIVERNRGGWCFELNGAFAALLEALGFSVTMVGAAVLLDGPSSVITHLTLEVALDEPYLVDVGFGESFINPLLLNDRGPQDGGTGIYELIDSDEGITVTNHDDDGVPVPQYRFTRVRRELADFDPASNLLQFDRSLHWSQKPFATRLLDHGPDRITLLQDRVKLINAEEVTETPVDPDDWDGHLRQLFGMERSEP